MSQHVWQCQGTGANTMWEEAIHKFTDALESIHTQPHIIWTIQAHLQAWHYGTNPPMDKEDPLNTAIV